MKKSGKIFGFIALVAIVGMIMASCAGFVILGGGGSSSSTAVTIRADSNLTSIRLGGTLQFTATGRNIIWTVSSTIDGTGPVSDGTRISGNGVLIVSITEIYTIIYVIATSNDTGLSDYKEIRIAEVTGVNVTPASQSIRAGTTQQFNAAVAGVNNPDSAVTWRVSSNAAGTGAVTQGTGINANGMLTIAARETLPALYVIATSVVDPSQSGNAVVGVIIPTVSGVSVSPANQSITAGRTLQLNSSVAGTNDPDTTVTWKVSSNAAGTGAVTQGTSINNRGLLTVAPNERTATLFVIATSSFDPTKSGSVIVNIIVPTVSGVAVSPANQSIERGRTLQFTASVTGSNNPSNDVTWRVSSNAAGNGNVASGTSINNNGLLTVSANETAATLFVFATSVVDTARSASVIVNVIIPTVSGVTVSPSNQSVDRGRTLQFSAAVTGSNNPSNAVTWRVSSNAAGNGAVASGTSINNNGLLTVAANETAATLYVFATSAADTTKSGSAAVSVTGTQNTGGGNQQRPGNNQPGQGNQPGPGGNQPGQGNQPGGNQNRPGQNQPAAPTVTSVTVSPANQSVVRGGTLQFRAAVTGTNNPGAGVTWRVSSNAAGTGAVTSGTSINANGLLTVAANETRTPLYIIATSTTDTSKSGSVTVTVTTPAPTVTSVTVNPQNQSIRAGSTLQFNATITGTNSPSNAVTWRVSSNAAGTGAVAQGTSISSNGLLTIASNESSSTLYIIATSVADPTKSGSTTVTNRGGNQNDQGQNNNSQGNQNSQGQNQQ